MTSIVAHLDAEHLDRLNLLRTRLNKPVDDIIAAAIDGFYQQQLDTNVMPDLTEMTTQSLAHLEEEFADYKERYPRE
jgi:hypothetical protein